MAAYKKTPTRSNKTKSSGWIQQAVTSAMHSMQLVLPLFGTNTQSTNLNPRTTNLRGNDLDPRVSRSPETRSPAGGKVTGEGSSRQTLVDDQVLQYLFRRRRRKSIGFTIDQRGLIVSAPRSVSMADIDEAVREKAPWIIRKLAEWDAFESRLASLDTVWEDGGRLRYLGHTLIIKLSERHAQQHLDMSCAPWELHVPLSPDAEPTNIRVLVEAWLKDRATEILDRRLQHFAPTLGIAPRCWKLSNARTQWGSCTADGVIHLNWRLVNLPMDLLDYVVAHELAHLQEMNHGPAFWATVKKMLPDYERAKDQLHAMPEHLAL